MAAEEIEIPTENKIDIDIADVGFPLKFSVDSAIAKEFDFKWNPGFGRMEVSGPEGINFFIVQDTISCSTKKAEIESGIFEIDYLQDDFEVLFYEAKLPHGSSPYFHFFASLDIGGEIYNFENNPLVEFGQHEIAAMVELAKSFKTSKND